MNPQKTRILIPGIIMLLLSSCDYQFDHYRVLHNDSDHQLIVVVDTSYGTPDSIEIMPHSSKGINHRVDPTSRIPDPIECNSDGIIDTILVEGGKEIFNYFEVIESWQLSKFEKYKKQVCTMTISSSDIQ